MAEADGARRVRSAAEQAQYDKLVGTPVTKLIPKLAVPTVLSMMVTMLYNLADSYFVGRLGTSASASVGIVLSILATFQAFGFLFGHGAGAVVSRQLGQGQKEEAGKTASTGFFLAFFVGFVLSVLGLLTIHPLMRLLGSTETILPYAVEYGRCIFFSGMFFASSCVLNNVLRYEGRAFYAMIGLVSGSVLNIFLDPLFIFGFGLGIRGAGIATALSQTISFLLLLSMFLRGKTVSHLSVRNIDLKHFATTSRICRNGLPSLVRQMLAMFGTTILNVSARPYGDAAIAAMTIDGRVAMFIFAFVLGIGQGYQPVAAYNHGAGRNDRVREGYWFTLITSEIVVGVLAVLAMVFAAPVVGFFRDDPEVIRIGAKAMYFFGISAFFQPVSVCTNMMFQSIGNSRIATFLSSLRSGLYYIPILLILPRFLGLLGIQSAVMWSDLLTALTSFPFALRYFRQLKGSGQR
ncbi:MAG: MATE family efflux transporter [Clostridia bacterium]|nr:MATE family efflux transporter [Clostridia bacterium]